MIKKYFFPVMSLLLAGSIGCSRHGKFVKMSAAETGIDFNNQISETPENNIMTYQYMYNGAGIAAGDVNNDGLPDLYVSGNSVSNRLFLNKGNWKFENITDSARVNDRKGDWKTGVTMADVNGDGWLDIYVCYSGNTVGEGLNKPVMINSERRSNQLFINNGCKPGKIPTFTESSKEYGLDAPGTFSTQAYFFDYDKDGDLDMFLVNHANTFYSSLFNTTKLRFKRHPCFGNKLYRNDAGHFKEVSEQAGIFGSGLNYGLSAGISDLNGDGWPDIYVTNDYDEQDFCYMNNGNGTFREVSHLALAHISKYSMGCDIADINNDGKPEIFTVDMLPEDNHRQKLLKGADQYDKYTLAVDSGYHHQNMRNMLQVNCGNDSAGNPLFSEQGQAEGISSTDWSWAPLFADFDNDGFKDIVITNGYLHDYTNLDFLKFAQNTIVNKGSQTTGDGILSVIRKMPSTRISSYLMHNTDGLHFENKTEAWGLSEKAISNAAVYADFDNDGDLDIVINRLNDNIAVYKNELNLSENNYIKIKLKGEGFNRFGTGAKIWVTTGEKKILEEAFCGRGYESSVEPVYTIGIGNKKIIKQIKVCWPDGKISVLENVASNQLIEISEQTNSAIPDNHVIGDTLFFKDILAGSGIDFRHIENDFVDYKMQRLLPYQLSHLGGKMAVGDVNNDGNDDVYFGAAAGSSGLLYLGKNDGTFILSPAQPWQSDKMCEDAGAVFFDADGDGDKDLYVVSGGNEYGSGDSYYQDRLYLNDGKGIFVKSAGALPEETTSGSCVVPFDFDKDGDLDLFIGGRLAAQMYPISPKSFIFRNDSRNTTVKFTDVTSQLTKELVSPGMVTDALWMDMDGDGWEDLVLAGEWMPVRVFRNIRGMQFKDITASLHLGASQGWWSKISRADVDGDGDVDLLLGNAGENLPPHPTEKEPMEYFIQDIDNNNSIDPIMCYYIQGRSFPAPTLDELVDQVPGLRKKYFKYEDYADAQIDDILKPRLYQKSDYLKTVTLRSSWIENQGNGRYQMKDLPKQAQLSMINGFIFDDFDGDGKKELLCAGNFYPYKVEWGKCDASMGVLVKFRDGEAVAYHSDICLRLSGDIRDMAIVRSSSGVKRLIVSRDNDFPGLYSFKQVSGQNDVTGSGEHIFCNRFSRK